MKLKMGRPKLPKGTANTVLFAVKIPANEAEKIHAATKKTGLSKAEWARQALIHAVGQLGTK